ncbi:MAG: hypothetical protein ACTSWJ_11005 [Candidatus Heimdallarchaeaceae archaeon]
MNENLSKLVQETTTPPAPVFTESQLDLPVEDPSDEVIPEPVEAQAAEEEEEAPSAVESIETTTLSSWFEENGADFDNISRVALQIRGVNPDGYLIMAVKDPAGGTDRDGNQKRVLRLFEGADVQPVLNIPASFMDVYNIGFQIIYPYQNMIIKTYALRTGLISVFCHIDTQDGRTIPYAITRIKKKDEQLEVVRGDDSNLSDRLDAEIDKEAAQLLYKQCSKVVVGFEKNVNLIDWLLARQAIITDINHHLQIDQVIISLLGY